MYIQFIKPISLNGEQLIDELANSGVIVHGVPEIDGDGNFWLDIDEADAAKAKPIVAKHLGVDTPNPDSAIKASIGTKLGSPTYIPLNAQEIIFLAKALS